MNTRTIQILFGIFLLLLLIVSLPRWQNYFRFDRFIKPQTELDLAIFTMENTQEILVRQKDAAEIKMRRTNGAWQVNDFPASSKEVGRFFDALSNLTVDTMVSRNPENQGSFEVTEEKGLLFTLKKDDTSSEFIIGKHAPVPDTFYLSTKDGEKVYQVKGTLKSLVSRSVNAWRDKEVLNTEEEKVGQISVESRDFSFRLRKNEQGIWQSVTPSEQTELSRETVNQLFQALNPLEATDFLTEEEIKKFQAVSNYTTVKIFDNQENLSSTLKLFKEDSLWWGQLEGQEIFYKIPEYNLENLMKSREFSS